MKTIFLLIAFTSGFLFQTPLHSQKTKTKSKKGQSEFILSRSVKIKLKKNFPELRSKKNKVKRNDLLKNPRTAKKLKEIRTILLKQKSDKELKAALQTLFETDEYKDPSLIADAVFFDYYVTIGSLQKNETAEDTQLLNTELSSKLKEQQRVTMMFTNMLNKLHETAMSIVKNM